MLSVTKAIQKLVNGETTVSELSDENCRSILRGIIYRHKNALAQLDAQWQADHFKMYKINAENGDSIKPLEEK